METTRWSLVLAAGQPSPESNQALSQLCEKYWYPLYAYTRSTVGNLEDAQDLTQSFFTTLIEKNYVAEADPTKGRFRTFLLAALKNFLSKQRDWERAAKRGGGRKVFSLDFDVGESRFQNEPATIETPETLFHRQWVLELTRNALERIEAEWVSKNQLEKFLKLKPFLVSPGPENSLARTAQLIGISPEAMRVAVHRIRQRYGELIRTEIAATVGDPADIDAEITELFRMF